jgi:Ca-activated chloride channel family protein
MRTTTRAVILFGLAALLALPALSLAQSKTTGAIEGTVRDKAGGALIDVSVVVTGPAMQGSQAALTDEQGHYLVTELPPGTYEVVFYVDKLKLRRQGVIVSAGKVTPLHTRLDTSQRAKEQVVIQRAPSIDTGSAKTGLTISPDYVRNIPVPGRSFEGAIGAAAGAQGDGLGVSFSGSTSIENNYIVDGAPSGEAYRNPGVNAPVAVKDDRLSTFAVDVDTASYTIARRKITSGEVVPKDAVRVEEFVNYFRYAYAGPTGKDRAFEVHTDGAPSPFAPGKHLVRIGVQGQRVGKSARKPAHLVFLVDVSGSMQSDDKLPLAQRSLRILVDNLNDGDTVALVTYAGSTRVVLEPTGMDRRGEIMAAIDGLTAGGSTAMASGIELAYQLAGKRISKGAISRVIILSDGDANVGSTSHEAILDSIAGQVRKGVTLSTVGFGMGNYKDTLMEQLANKGNGESYYIDSLSAARRVFQEQLGGTLEVIAQDVKIQVEWHPATVTSYRLLGYENRDIADEDFRNDKVDAGEIGAGHTVTAIYEVALASGADGPLATVRIRAKRPGGKEAAEWAFPTQSRILRGTFDAASVDFRFACAVAAFAEILRGSPHAKGWKLTDVARIARAAAGTAEDRQEFVTLVGKVKLAP